MDNPTKPQPPATKQTEPTASQSTTMPPQERMSVVTVVAAAVLVAVGLIAVGFFAYNAKDEPVSTQPTVQTETIDVLDTTSPVNEQTIDSEVEQIDQTVSDLDNDSDFSESDLSEAELGF